MQNHLLKTQTLLMSKTSCAYTKIKQWSNSYTYILVWYFPCTATNTRHQRLKVINKVISLINESQSGPYTGIHVPNALRRWLTIGHRHWQSYIVGDLVTVARPWVNTTQTTPPLPHAVKTVSKLARSSLRYRWHLHHRLSFFLLVSHNTRLIASVDWALLCFLVTKLVLYMVLLWTAVKSMIRVILLKCILRITLISHILQCK